MMRTALNKPAAPPNMRGNTFSSYAFENEDLSDFDINGIFEDDAILGIQEDCSSSNYMKRRDHANADPNGCGLSACKSSISSPPASKSTQFVNLYMVLDPATGETTFPNQILNSSHGDMLKTALVGPSLRTETSTHEPIRQQQQQWSLDCGHSFNKVSHEVPFGCAMSQEESTLHSIFTSAIYQQGHDSVQQVPINHETACQLPAVSTTISPCNSEGYNTHQESTSLQRLFASAVKANTPTTQTSSGAPVPPKSRASKASKEKSTDLPFRPLSAYNFFFQTERDKILHGHKDHVVDGDDEDWSEARKQRILRVHWNRDRTQKRRHRKSHGRISFVELSKQISHRWKRLPDRRKQFYRDVSALDHARYKRGCTAAAAARST